MKPFARENRTTYKTPHKWLDCSTAIAANSKNQIHTKNNTSSTIPLLTVSSYRTFKISFWTLVKVVLLVIRKKFVVKYLKAKIVLSLSSYDGWYTEKQDQEGMGTDRATSPNWGQRNEETEKKRRKRGGKEEESTLRRKGGSLVIERTIVGMRWGKKSQQIVINRSTYKKGEGMN